MSRGATPGALCRALIAERLDFRWACGDLKPIGITDDFCRLLADSGCCDLNLAIESASETMLQRMKRGYTVRQVREKAGFTREGLLREYAMGQVSGDVHMFSAIRREHGALGW